MEPLRPGGAPVLDHVDLRAEDGGSCSSDYYYWADSHLDLQLVTNVTKPLFRIDYSRASIPSGPEKVGPNTSSKSWIHRYTSASVFPYPESFRMLKG